MRTNLRKLIQEASNADVPEKETRIGAEFLSPQDLVGKRVKDLFADGSEEKLVYFDGIISNSVISFPDFLEVTYDVEKEPWIFDLVSDLAENFLQFIFE